MKNNNKIYYILILSFLILSCNDNSEVDRRLDSVTENQEIVIKKLESIEKNQNAVKLDISKLSEDIKKIGSTSKPADNKKKKEPPKTDSNKVYDIAIGNSVVLGKSSAPITIIEWSDFQWPHCANSVSLIDQILEKYPNDVKVVVKNFPLSFHKQAYLAAQYCLAAREQGGDKVYKELSHKIFENFRTLKNNPDLPVQLAAEMGLDTEKLKTDAQSSAIKSLIDEEINQMKNSGIPRMSVPKFLINGKEPQGRSFEAWSTMIDEELKKLKSKE